MFALSMRARGGTVRARRASAAKFSASWSEEATNMSRIAKYPVPVPDKVQVTVDASKIVVKGHDVTAQHQSGGAEKSEDVRNAPQR